MRHPPRLTPTGFFHFSGWNRIFGFVYAHMSAEKLKEMGIEILHGPKQRPDGAVQVYFKDPDGHTVELVSNP